MTEAEARYIQRLPGQIVAARAKLRALETAARRYRMNDLLTGEAGEMAGGQVAAARIAARLEA